MGFGLKWAPVALAALTAWAAHAQVRHYRALVIGEGAYSRQALQWPVENARAVAGRLKELGYEVKALENASRPQFTQALATLKESIRAGDVVLFYYAGRATREEETSLLLALPNDFARVLGSGSEVPLTQVVDALQWNNAAAAVAVLDVLPLGPANGNSRSEWMAGLPKSTSRMVVASGTGRGKGSVTEKLLGALERPEGSVADLFVELGAPRIRGGANGTAKIPRAPIVEPKAPEAVPAPPPTPPPC